MKYALIGMMALIVAGCGVRPPVQGRADPFVPVQITLASGDLANNTAIGAPLIERRNNGIMYVTVPIRSASEWDLHIDYRFTFLSATGQPIEQSSWIGGKTLVRNVQDSITFNSMSANAADFRMEIRLSE